MEFWSTFLWAYGYRATSLYVTSQIGVCPLRDVCSVYLLTHFVTVCNWTLCWQQVVGGLEQLAVVKILE